LTGVAVLGLYYSHNNAIRAGMRKVYQLMNIHTKKVDGEWTWIDEQSFISIMEIDIADALDLKSESPLPQFFRYREVLQDTPIEDLERLRNQVLNRKKVLEKLKALRQGI
jgi:hypothetical protein